MTSGPLQENRVWVVAKPNPDGSATVTLTMKQPVNVTASMGVLRSKGMVTQDLVLTIPRSPNDGKDATPEQVAAAVATYLTANPPAPGRAPTSAEILAAVTTYMTANPGLTKVEFSVSLVDAYAVGLAAGGDSKRIACAGLKTTDVLTVQPTGILPAGYMIGTPSCTENGWVRIGFVRPLLAVGASNTIALKLSALR